MTLPEITFFALIAVTSLGIMTAFLVVNLIGRVSALESSLSKIKRVARRNDDRRARETDGCDPIVEKWGNKYGDTYRSED